MTSVVERAEVATDGLDADGPRHRSRRADAWSGRLPTGRALLGAVLVIAAAGGVLAAHRAATSPPTTRYVVVTRDLAVGETVGANDLGTLAIDLPGAVRAVAAADAGSLVGTVVRNPLSELDLLRPDDVGDPDTTPDPGSMQVPVEVDRARSLDGSVNAGSRVDVLSTDPDGAGTVVLARDVLVTAVGDGDEGTGIGAGDAVRFRLAVADDRVAAAVVDASVRSQLTLVLPDPSGAGRG